VKSRCNLCTEQGRLFKINRNEQKINEKMMLTELQLTIKLINKSLFIFLVLTSS